MPESLYRQQKACKPRVEDVLPDVLGEDTGKALAFADALRDAKIRLSWTLTNQWKAAISAASPSARGRLGRNTAAGS